MHVLQLTHDSLSESELVAQIGRPPLLPIATRARDDDVVRPRSHGAAQLPNVLLVNSAVGFAEALRSCDLHGVGVVARTLFRGRALAGVSLRNAPSHVERWSRESLPVYVVDCTRHDCCLSASPAAAAVGWQRV